MPRRRHWLCFAYSFPPVNRSGTFRTLGFVRHLHEAGWDATVVCATPDGEPVDQCLLDQIPPGTTVIRVPCPDRIARLKSWVTVHRSSASSPRQGIPRDRQGTSSQQAASPSLREFITRALLVPDNKAGWIRPAWRAARAALRERPASVIYSTSPCQSAHLAAMHLGRKTGLPWVTDFRDPWRDNPFRSSTYHLLDRWDARLERQVLTGASWIICNTQTARSRMISRLPWVGQKSSTILNGFDPELLEGIRPIRDPRLDGKIVLTHCGQFYGRRDPRPWLLALRTAIDRAPMLGQTLRLQLIGSPDYDGRPLIDVARKCGVADCVQVSGSMGHREALGRVAASDAVILAGSSGPDSDLQIPNKLFEYLALRRPILATLAPEHPARGILAAAKAQAVVLEPDKSEAVAAALAAVADGAAFSTDVDWSGVEKFQRRERAAELLDVFDRLTSSADRNHDNLALQAETGGLEPALQH